jgi:ATP-dependent DNA ligase
LGYYTDDGKLIYAGRVGTGMPIKVLADLRRRLDPIARRTSPLNVLPPRKTRFGSPLVLSRVHWVEPNVVAEITYLTWTADNLLRHTVYVGLREDKPASRSGAPRDLTERITPASRKSFVSRLTAIIDIGRLHFEAAGDLSQQVEKLRVAVLRH